MELSLAETEGEAKRDDVRLGGKHNGVAGYRRETQANWSEAGEAGRLTCYVMGHA